jgi:hypothetical protein
MPHGIHFPATGMFFLQFLFDKAAIIQNTLECRFKQSRYLSVGERTKLAQTLSLSETQVKREQLIGK